MLFNGVEIAELRSSEEESCMNKNRTVFWIIILIPLILVVPVNIVVIHNAQKEMQYLVEERTNESQSYIQSMGNNVERDLQTVEEYMQMLVTQGD